MNKKKIIAVVFSLAFFMVLLGTFIHYGIKDITIAFYSSKVKTRDAEIVLCKKSGMGQGDNISTDRYSYKVLYRYSEGSNIFNDSCFSWHCFENKSVTIKTLDLRNNKISILKEGFSNPFGKYAYISFILSIFLTVYFLRYKEKGNVSKEDIE